MLINVSFPIPKTFMSMEFETVVIPKLMQAQMLRKKIP